MTVKVYPFTTILVLCFLSNNRQVSLVFCSGCLGMSGCLDGHGPVRKASSQDWREECRREDKIYKTNIQICGYIDGMVYILLCWFVHLIISKISLKQEPLLNDMVLTVNRSGQRKNLSWPKHGLHCCALQWIPSSRASWTSTPGDKPMESYFHVALVALGALEPSISRLFSSFDIIVAVMLFPDTRNDHPCVTKKVRWHKTISSGNPVDCSSLIETIRQYVLYNYIIYYYTLRVSNMRHKITLTQT